MKLFGIVMEMPYDDVWPRCCDLNEDCVCYYRALAESGWDTAFVNHPWLTFHGTGPVMVWGLKVTTTVVNVTIIRDELTRHLGRALLPSDQFGLHQI